MKVQQCFECELYFECDECLRRDECNLCDPCAYRFSERNPCGIRILTEVETIAYLITR